MEGAESKRQNLNKQKGKEGKGYFPLLAKSYVYTRSQSRKWLSIFGAN